MTKEEINKLIENVKRVAILAEELGCLADNYMSLEKNGSYLSISNTAINYNEFLHPDWMHRPSWCGTFDFPHRFPLQPEVRNEAIGTDIKDDVAEIIAGKIQAGWESLAALFSEINAQEADSGTGDENNPETEG